MSATIKDISRHTGLAISTISKYINGGNVLPENQKKIQKAIDELKFSVNSFARAMKTNRSNLVGIVVSQPADCFSGQLISFLQKMLTEYGDCCIIEDCDRIPESQEAVANFLLSKNVDVLIFLDMYARKERLNFKPERDVAVLTIGATHSNDKCDRIVFDEQEAVATGLAALLAKTDKVAYLGGSGDEERNGMYRRALSDAQVPVDSGYVSMGACTADSGYQRMMSLLQAENPPGAVFIAHPNLAVGAYIAIQECGKRVPDDIEILSFDNSGLPASCRQRMNLITVPMARISSAVSNLLIERINTNLDFYFNVYITYELTCANRKSESNAQQS